MSDDEVSLEFNDENNEEFDIDDNDDNDDNEDDNNDDNDIEDDKFSETASTTSEISTIGGDNFEVTNRAKLVELNKNTSKKIKGKNIINQGKTGGDDDNDDDEIEEVDDDTEYELLDEETTAALEDEYGERPTIDKIIKKEKAEEPAVTKKSLQVFKKIIEVAPEKRKTSNILTRFEMTEILSIRTQQISEGSMHFIDTKNEILSKLTDPKDIAELEFNMRRCPLRLRRKIGEKRINGILHEFIEYFNVNQMGRPPLVHLN